MLWSVRVQVLGLVIGPHWLGLCGVGSPVRRFFLRTRQGLAQKPTWFERDLATSRNAYAFTGLGVSSTGLRVGVFDGERTEATCFDPIAIDDGFGQSFEERIHILSRFRFRVTKSVGDRFNEIGLGYGVHISPQ